MPSLRRNAASLVACAALLSLTPLTARTVVKNDVVLLAMAANAKRMMQYEWKQRITVVRNGSATEPIVDQIRFGTGGEMQRTTVSAPAPKEMHGLRGRIAAGVKEDVKQIMEKAGAYNKPEQMVAAIRKAQITSTPDANMTRLEAQGVLEPTDMVIILVKSATHLATHIDIKTSYKGGPMSISQDYSPLPDGPNVMKTMKVSASQKGLAVNVDSYDYARQSAAIKP